nr:SAM-dependent methyltransferase [Streptomyces sp. AJS327]
MDRALYGTAGASPAGHEPDGGTPAHPRTERDRRRTETVARPEPGRTGPEAADRGTGPETADTGGGPEANPGAPGAGAAPGAPGFFVREAPGAHFRTSVHASPLFAAAVTRLLRRVDRLLGHPSPLTLVDVGAGRGELLTSVRGLVSATPELARRLRTVAVERAPRPSGLDPAIEWRADLPPEDSVTGLLFANEWLDNVPLDIAERDASGVTRYVLTDPAGEERLGAPLTEADAAWQRRWWPLPDDDPGAGTATGPTRGSPTTPPPLPGPTPGTGIPSDAGTPRTEWEPDAETHSGGHSGGDVASLGANSAPDGDWWGVAGYRVELGAPRDHAWAAAVRTVRAGLAVAVDYAHTRADRPPHGTLTGYRDGRQVRPVPDGGRDLTAHVALDACAEAAGGGSLLTQRTALRALGVRGDRPPLALASRDPARYVRALAEAGEAAELTARDGLGAFHWLLHPVGPALPPADPAGSTDPTGPTYPAGSVRPTDPTGHTGLAAPTGSGISTGPAHPADSVPPGHRPARSKVTDLTGVSDLTHLTAHVQRTRTPNMPDPTESPDTPDTADPSGVLGLLDALGMLGTPGTPDTSAAPGTPIPPGSPGKPNSP